LKRFTYSIAILLIFALAMTASTVLFAYTANTYSNSVSVIDTTTDNVTASISVGTSPFGVACAPDGTHVYVTNQDSNTVSIIL
jgi:40-residue YVTN family beta-propeller repeat